MKNIFILFIIMAGSTSIGLAQHDGVKSAQGMADSLYDHFYEAEALEVYRSILKENPNTFVALWRTSFLYSRIGYRFEDEQRQRSYINKGIQLAKQALSVDSSHTKSNFVMAVALGRKAMISGARERVEASRSIKRYAERAIRLDSTNAGAWHVLGRWHFKVTNLNLLERVAANTLFGGIPEASESKAIQSIKKAIELNSKYILYYYDLARMYKHVGEEQQAVATCKQALQKKPLTPDDPELLEKCRNIIKSLR